MNTVSEGNRRRELARCEGIIRRGLDTFVQVGLALTKIREERLYRYAEGKSYKSFDEYCRTRWGFSGRQANREIAAARAAEIIIAGADGGRKTGPVGPVPANESQARPLAALKDDPKAVRQVWQQSIDYAGGKQPTAEQVQTAVRHYRAQGADSEPRDLAPPASGLLNGLAGVKQRLRAVFREAVSLDLPEGQRQALGSDLDAIQHVVDQFRDLLAGESLDTAIGGIPGQGQQQPAGGTR